MKKEEFSFDLPEELIAQDPLLDRASSRLLVLEKESGQMEHHTFKDIIDYLNKGDCLVVNDTKVIPARLIGSKVGTDANIEVLLLKRKENDIWETLVKPGKKAKAGVKISFGDGLLIGEVLEVVEEGNRLIQFTYEGIFEEILDRLGQMPLPPYITHQLEDKNRYQTVYATNSGSAAAPTAGLHFTPELLASIEKKGVTIARVTLHVGLGTFRPVKVDNILEHHMHSEYYQIGADAACKINQAKACGGRVIGVGTTSCRTIESAAKENGEVQATSGFTQIFIYPGYEFKVLDCLITNFHLPESTLMMLVSALAGRDHIMAAYEEAIKEKYRFFSFGDAMFITNKIIAQPKVRQATKDDFDAICMIEKECFPQTEAADAASIRERMNVFLQHFFVLENAGEIIGFINGMVTNDETITDALFENAKLHREDGAWQSVFGLDVIEKYRGFGYARMLMNSLMKQAKDQGRKGIILTCKEHLIPFYESFGYDKIGISQSVHGGARWYDMACCVEHID